MQLLDVLIVLTTPFGGTLYQTKTWSKAWPPTTVATTHRVAALLERNRRRRARAAPVPTLVVGHGHAQAVAAAAMLLPGLPREDSPQEGQGPGDPWRRPLADTCSRPVKFWNGWTVGLPKTAQLLHSKLKSSYVADLVGGRCRPALGMVAPRSPNCYLKVLKKLFGSVIEFGLKLSLKKSSLYQRSVTWCVDEHGVQHVPKRIDGLASMPVLTSAGYCSNLFVQQTGCAIVSLATLERFIHCICLRTERLLLLLRPGGFKVFCDHRNLIHVFAPSQKLKKHVRGKLLRWTVKLTEFRYTIIHIEGVHNLWADMIIRWDSDSSATTSTTLVSSFKRDTRSQA
ncbi:unnamed protein product [Phytophthora fragariaefolia]|uniref:Unnamed protein product n=1 Tax=Phytophthora fragariaefolia TaxID=1490495 RepID=A0A9W6XE90_9STRA|nr:unnamed protein product [Phytophthora fragariaefolia]